MGTVVFMGAYKGSHGYRKIYKYIDQMGITMNTIKTIFVAMLFVSVPIAGISIWQGDTQDFIQDFFDDEIENEEQSPNSLVEWDVHYAMSPGDLPLCDSSTEGRLYYVQSSMEFQVCLSNGWSVIDIEGPQGDNGISVLMRVSTSSFCPFTGHEFELGNDVNENGALEDDEVVVSVDICDGSDGIDGIDGADGIDGTNGINSLTNVTEEAVGSNNCGNGGLRIDVGLDLDSNGILEISEIESTHYVCNGSFASNVLLSSVNDLGVTENCSAGKIEIFTGLDDGLPSGIAGNGALELGELQTHVIECHKFAFGAIGDIVPGISTSEFHFTSKFGENILLAKNNLYLVNLSLGSSELLCSSCTSDGSSNQWNTVLESLFFFEGVSSGNDALWVTDGTPEGTHLLAYIQVQSTMLVAGNEIYFMGDEAAYGRELWKSDGTVSGTMMVADVNTGNSDSYAWPMVFSGGTVYFTADDGIHGKELWKTDGTALNTTMVIDLRQGYSGSNIGGMVEFNGTFFFGGQAGYNDGIGNELWTTDGTESGTSFFMDLRPGSDSSTPGNFVVLGDLLLFNARNETGSQATWSTDGSVTGTTLISTNIGWIDKTNPTIDGYVYSLGDSEDHGYEVWRTDGTSLNTSRITDIREGQDSSLVSDMVAQNNELYFTARDYKYSNGEIILSNDLYVYNHSTDTLNTLPVAKLGNSDIGKIFVIDGDVYLTSVSMYGMEIFAYGNAVIIDEERIQ